MSIVVEHDKRRREILEKALDIFVEEGFEDATFQKIADRCGITRTTLYIYFKNKKEIFMYSVKQLLQGVEGDIQKTRREKLRHAERLATVMNVILGRLVENRRLLLVLLDYLRYLAKTGGDPDNRVRRRTVRVRHILANMVIEGVEAGEFAPVSVRDADELLYGILETAVFRLTVLKRAAVDELSGAVTLAVRRLQTTNDE